MHRSADPLSDALEELVGTLRASQLPEPSERRAIRLRARVSLREAARTLKVSPNTLQQWESGAVATRRAAAIRYRELLDALDAALQ